MTAFCNDSGRGEGLLEKVGLKAGLGVFAGPASAESG
jgi:hypothetical protein